MLADSPIFAPYGELVQGSLQGELGFHSHEWHQEAELYQMRQRWYDVGSMRFLSRDPVLSQPGSSYQLVGASPVMNGDPLGLLRIPDDLQRSHPRASAFLWSLSPRSHDEVVNFMVAASCGGRQNVLNAFTPGRGPAVFGADLPHDRDGFYSPWLDQILIDEELLHRYEVGFPGSGALLEVAVAHEVTHHLDWLDGARERREVGANFEKLNYGRVGIYGDDGLLLESECGIGCSP